MKANTVKQKKNQKFEEYRNIITGIEFMEKFMEDPDALCSDSPKFKTFLIQSFSYLHSDFHYLSFINSEDVDKEIVKAARILQILPVNNTNKLFDSMDENDIRKFWDKFFSLFKNKKQSDFKTDSIFSLSWENKINFFTNMKNTSNYLNYEFPVVNFWNLKSSDIDKEITNWKEQIVNAESNKEELTSFVGEEEETVDVDIERLLSDLNQVMSMYLNMRIITKENEYEHLNFFSNFTCLSKNILDYKKNIEIVYSKILDDLKCDFILKNVDLSENFYFLRKCSNFVNILKSKNFVLKV